jgi:hypothetical protein
MRSDRQGARSPPAARDNEATQRAQASVRARQKLIEAMIDNNMQTWKSESARGGAEIERACALRDCERDRADAAAAERLREVELKLHRLGEERRRLLAEREWLTRSLFEVDSSPAAERGRPLS